MNGRPLELSDGSTIAQLLEQLKVARQAVAVEVNAQVIRRAHHAEHRLSSGDTVEVVTFVGGG